MSIPRTPWDEDYSQAWRDGFYAAKENSPRPEDKPAWKHLLVVMAVGFLLNVGFYGGLWLLLSPSK